jgi:DNA-binding winged helix-turn-helix (wHTH) protein/TolB-like protein/predicted Zn-dependent protease
MNALVHRNYLFDGFTVDLARGCLLRESEELKLRPKSFKALTYLVENRGRLISKEELIGAIWPDVAVTDDSLVQCLMEIRKALGGDAQRYIKTAPRRGYIFEAQVTVNGRAPDAAKERGEDAEIAKAVDEAAMTAHGRAVFPKAASLLIRLRSNKKVLATLTLAIAMLSVLLSRFAFRGQIASISPEFRSMAVLPFKEIGAAGDGEFLGLGMTDTLINNLSNATEIIIRNTSAVRRYAKPDQDPVAAGREQGVDAVLDGNIQKSGESIRVSVQLLRVRDGKLLWTDHFDEKLADIFTVEDSIAERVVEALSLRLNGGEKQRLTKHDTRNLEAYFSYQLGNKYLAQHTRAGHIKAIGYYRTAIQKDPDFAQAHVALASIYNSPYCPLSVLECQQKAESETRTALQQDSNLAEAHALTGNIKVQEQDYSAAEIELTRAMTLGPTSESVLGSYYQYLLLLGKYDEAMAMAQRLIDLDPLEAGHNGIVPYIHIRARHCDQALEEFQKLRQAYPTYIPATNNIGAAYMCKGLYKEAAAEFEKTVPVQDAPERASFASLAFAYARSGRREKAQEMLRELQEESTRRYIDPRSFANIYAGLGENDRAFDYLEKAYKDRSGPPYVHLLEGSLWEALRSDPRWVDFARRKGLAN